MLPPVYSTTDWPGLQRPPARHPRSSRAPSGPCRSRSGSPSSFTRTSAASCAGQAARAERQASGRWHRWRSSSRASSSGRRRAVQQMSFSPPHSLQSRWSRACQKRFPSPFLARSRAPTCGALRPGLRVARAERADVALCDVGGIDPDAVTVEPWPGCRSRPARGCQVRLREASAELLEVVRFMGLRDVLPESRPTARSRAGPAGRRAGRGCRCRGRT